MRKTVVRAPRQAVVVCWIDHSEPVDKRTWDAPTHPDKLYPCLVFSTGFLCAENEQILEISRDISEHGSVGACLHILKKCIIYRKNVVVPAVPSLGPPTVKRKR